MAVVVVWEVTKAGTDDVGSLQSAGSKEESCFFSAPRPQGLFPSRTERQR